MKPLSFGFFLSFAILSSEPTFSNPEGGSVSAGSATISNPTADTVQVHQTTDKAVINWQSYNVAPHEKVNYQQPSASSISLNRINPHQGPSSIYGTINANGQVWLINPAGIWFGPSAHVNVAGLLATTADISDQDFMAGHYHFVQSPDWHGAIVNEGIIKTTEAGLVALVGSGVVNHGYIEANLGTVILAAGSEFTVNFSGNDLVSFTVDKEVISPAIDREGNRLSDGVKNTGKIVANGGKIHVTAKTAGKVLDNAINMAGVAEAKSVGVRNGEITLFGAGEAPVKVSGKLYASGKKAGERGGKVKILAKKKVIVVEQAEIDVSGDKGGGEVLIGGDYQGKNPAVPNAESTFFGSNAFVNADAITQGDGGKVILWADEGTGFYGTIYARGGRDGGNGGFIETSGKSYLDIRGGKVDANAPLGLSGSWLLDPRNVTIAAATAGGSFSGGDPNTFTPTANNATVDVATINASLDGGTSVTINTGVDGTQAGNITVSNAILKSAGLTIPTLTLDAAGSILVNSNITATSGGLNVVFTGSAATIGNTISATITTNGGNFTGTTQNAFNLGNAANLTTGIINVGSGTVTISANQDGAGTQAVVMNSGSSIASTNTSSNAVNISVNTAVGGSGTAALRDITVGSGGTITVATDASSTGGDITQASGTLDAGSGTINLTTSQASGRNIGDSGTPVVIKAGILNATTGSTGIFITNTGTSGLDLGTINSTGGLTLTSTSSTGITDSGTLSISGVATIDAGATQNITLNSAGNNFGTFAVTSGNNVTVVDTNALILGASTISGTYNVTAGGSITESGALTVAGTPTFTVTAAGSDILLETQANDFSTTPVFTNNGNIDDLGLY